MRVALVGDHLDWLAGEAITCAVSLGWTVLVRRADLTADAEAVGSDTHGERVLSALTEVLRARGLSAPTARMEVKAAPPTGTGLGSSSSLVVATVAAVTRLIGMTPSPLEIGALAAQTVPLIELVGGQMDEFTAALGGVHHLRFIPGFLPAVQAYDLPQDTRIVIGDSRARRRSGDIIGALRNRANTTDPQIAEFVTVGTRIIAEMLECLREPDPELAVIGRLMNEAHFNMSLRLGISTPLIDKLVETARGGGAYGAKLSGAGGGGAMFALCDSSSVPRVIAALESMGAETYVCTISSKGVNATRSG